MRAHPPGSNGGSARRQVAAGSGASSLQRLVCTVAVLVAAVVVLTFTPNLHATFRSRTLSTSAPALSTRISGGSYWRAGTPGSDAKHQPSRRTIILPQASALEPVCTGTLYARPRSPLFSACESWRQRVTPTYPVVTFPAYPSDPSAVRRQGTRTMGTNSGMIFPKTAPITTTPDQPQLELVSRWILLHDAELCLTRVRLGANLATAVRNGGWKVLLATVSDARAGSIEQHWRTVNKVPGELLTVLSPASQAQAWYTSLKYSEANRLARSRNAQYLFAIERGAQWVLDVHALELSGHQAYGCPAGVEDGAGGYSPDNEIVIDVPTTEMIVPAETVVDVAAYMPAAPRSGAEKADQHAGEPDTATTIELTASSVFGEVWKTVASAATAAATDAASPHGGEAGNAVHQHPVPQQPSTMTVAWPAMHLHAWQQADGSQPLPGVTSNGLAVLPPQQLFAVPLPGAVYAQLVDYTMLWALYVPSVNVPSAAAANDNRDGGAPATPSEHEEYMTGVALQTILLQVGVRDIGRHTAVLHGTGSVSSGTARAALHSQRTHGGAALHAVTRAAAEVLAAFSSAHVHVYDRALHALQLLFAAQVTTSGDLAAGSAWFQDLHSLSHEAPEAPPCIASAHRADMARSTAAGSASDQSLLTIDRQRPVPPIFQVPRSEVSRFNSSASAAEAGECAATLTPQPASVLLHQQIARCSAIFAARRHNALQQRPIALGCGERLTAPFWRRWSFNTDAQRWTMDWDGYGHPVGGATLRPVPPLPKPTDAVTRTPGPHAAMLPADVVVFVYTFRGRHDLMRKMAEAWGPYTHQLVYLTDDANDAGLGTVHIRSLRAEWSDITTTGHDSSLAPYGLLYLYEKYARSGYKFFINVDDDCMPFVPEVLEALAAWRNLTGKSGDEYPYFAAEPVIPSRHIPGRENLFARVDPSGNQVALARRLLPDFGWHPAGPLYSFNVTALHDMMRVVEALPILTPGDLTQGEIMYATLTDFYRRRDLHAVMFYGWWFYVAGNDGPMPADREAWRWSGVDHGYGDPLAGRTYAHYLKNKERVVAVYNAYYAAIWGEPPLEMEAVGKAPPRRDIASCEYPPPRLVDVPP